MAVVTNQSGVGRGYFSEETLADIHAAMQRAIEDAGGVIEGVYYCPHRPDEACACRKPKPLLLLRAMSELGADADSTWYIGDKLSDVEAARAAGVKPILVGPLAGEVAPPDVACFSDHAAAANAVITGYAR